MMERSLVIQERAYGGDHTRLAETLTTLGDVYRVLGDNAKARGVLERAFAINERAYGPDHPHTNMCQEALAELAS